MRDECPMCKSEVEWNGVEWVHTDGIKYRHPIDLPPPGGRRGA